MTDEEKRMLLAQMLMANVKPPVGPITPGNIDITQQRPGYVNPDGSTSTIRSIGVGGGQGETVIPTVADGQNLQSFILQNPYLPAIQRFRQTGQNLGTFGTPQAADNAGEFFHRGEIAKGYKR